ncbi:MAG: purine-nucleoside phosphorylase [Salinarimonas sp.]|nr:purine-nucleoside phosphorylase [Salinarimonas sp.]
MSRDHEAAIAEAHAALARAGFPREHACAIVLGTGLGGLVDDLEDAIGLDYAAIPHFPQSAVSGHAGRLVSGMLAGRRVLLMQGRKHYYETGDAQAMRVPIGLLAALGAPPLLLTNAAGSTSAEITPGSLAMISDHIAFSGMNPLIGESDERRFVTMSQAYDPGLAALLEQAAGETGTALERGVYMWFSGPSFETPAEIRMAQVMGADFVGMSTVPEVILARFYGLRVAGISTITNMAAGLSTIAPSHDETKRVAAQASADLRALLRAFVGLLPASPGDAGERA